MAGDIGIEERIIVVRPQDVQAASSLAARVRDAGGRVMHRYGARVMIAEVPEHRAEQVRAALGAAAAMAASSAELTSLHEPLDPIGALGLAAFDLRQSAAYAAAKRQRPHDDAPWDAGGELQPPDPPPELRHLMEPPPEFQTRGVGGTRGSTSRQMMGSIAVGIIIVSGPTRSLRFSNRERDKVIAEVQNGLGWHAAQNHLAEITWTYDIHSVKVDVRPGVFPDPEALWRNPAMEQLGYQGGWQGVYDYVDHIRAQSGSRWTFVGYFTKYWVRHFAYSTVGGPRVVMQYKNDTWGPDNIDRVFAHETGHVFQAPDEYADSGCNCGGSWGIYSKPNGNCKPCALRHVSCIMAKNSWAYCAWTPWHYGQNLLQYKIGDNLTLSTPVVTPDGWVWFQGMDHTLWKVFSDGTHQSNPGNNKIGAWPFGASSPVVVGEWVYFQGTDSALWRMKTDGSTQNIIAGNQTASTPFVTPDGWVWFQGTDNTLWKVFTDGSQQSKPGNNTTASPPFVAGDWVYFQGTDSFLRRMKTDGSTQNVIAGNQTVSPPFVTPEGWVWFQGTDNTLWKVFTDGSQQSKPGNNTTASSPFVAGDWVYFRGTDSFLRRMKTDGSAQNIIALNTTLSSPFVAGDWVYFRGVDNQLWACPVTA